MNTTERRIRKAIRDFLARGPLNERSNLDKEAPFLIARIDAIIATGTDQGVYLFQATKGTTVARIQKEEFDISRKLQSLDTAHAIEVSKLVDGPIDPSEV